MYFQNRCKKAAALSGSRPAIYLSPFVSGISISSTTMPMIPTAIPRTILPNTMLRHIPTPSSSAPTIPQQNGSNGLTADLDWGLALHFPPNQPSDQPQRNADHGVLNGLISADHRLLDFPVAANDGLLNFFVCLNQF